MASALRKHLRTPLAWFGLTVALIYLNQVLFTVYVIRVHHGDPSFISRYLPPGWFSLASGNPAIRALASAFPNPGLLAVTVLRVQAFLELPFTMLAYLTICSWLGEDYFVRALRLRWPASIVWTAMFCAIEWHLRNPYTTDDLVIRAAAGVVVPLWAGKLRKAPLTSAGLTAIGFGVFAVSTGALAYVVLTVYDSALLYNLGHLSAELPGTLAALAILAAARYLASRLRGERGLGIKTATGAFGWFLVVFFVPALPIRYGLLEGQSSLSILAGTIVVLSAAILAARDAMRSPGFTWPHWAGEMTAAIIAGALAALAARSIPGSHSESRILWMTSAFLLAATASCAVIDACAERRGLRPGC
ncbi:MAG: hypothetical protein JWM19_3448 [Actinomycetia bacterium]|nr:hypothetical protein [Actinomycetes bacterium]